MKPQRSLTIVRVTKPDGYAWYASIKGRRHLITGPPTNSAGIAHLRAIEQGFVIPGPHSRIHVMSEP